MYHLMFTRRGRYSHALLLMTTLVAFLMTSPLRAADHFLTIGGGGGPSHTQVSLEENVLYFQRILGSWGIDPACSDIYFACGTNPDRDVQFRDAIPVPRVNLLLSRVLDPGESLDLDYRPHQIPHVRGPSTRKSLTDWFDHVGSKLKDGDRLFIYYTGHGGPGRPARNTTLAMWGEDPMPVREFDALLDKLPPKVQVVMVMVQCHAGGFADVIFKNAKVGAGVDALSNQRRCGFFATTPDRLAAGCTADISAENYHEYSTYFFEALYGQTRTGKPVAAPDYDGDGTVSFAEANAYVELHSNTIDIPITTSDVFLRANSKLEAKNIEGLLTPDTSFDRLLALATPPQKAVMEGLSEQLKLYGSGRADAARREAARVQKRRGECTNDRGRLFKDMQNMRVRIATALIRRWPELASPWHPLFSSLLHDQADAILHAIEIHESYPAFEKLRKQVDEDDVKLIDLERRWVKTQRLLRTMEDVALAANLNKVAPKAVVERYDELLAGENGTIHSTPAHKLTAATQPEAHAAEMRNERRG